MLQVLWNGWEAFQAALDLVAAAEDASQLDAAQQAKEPQKFVWRQDMLRPATDAKQVLPGAFISKHTHCYMFKSKIHLIQPKKMVLWCIWALHLSLLPRLRLD